MPAQAFIHDGEAALRAWKALVADEAFNKLSSGALIPESSREQHCVYA